jgi:lysophospholipase L1-like esterase
MDFVKRRSERKLELPLTLASPLLTYSAWMRDRLYGIPNLAQADNLTASRWWHPAIHGQIKVSQSYEYTRSLFGDSISSGLGNTLGQGLFNFALGGLSSISLVEQLKIHAAADLKHSHVVIAIGTNDALYGTSDPVLTNNVRQALDLIRAMDATRIVLVGAFYATHQVSGNPWLAGSNQRINEINNLLETIAYEKQVHFVFDPLQDLFDGEALNPEFTRDGVHLNAKGKAIYAKILANTLDVKD